MTPLIECVPNFSEGRKPETVRLIAESIASVESACVLDTHIDPDHNRSVITFVASPERVVAAAVNAVRRASELIDMRAHQAVTDADAVDRDRLRAIGRAADHRRQHPFDRTPLDRTSVETDDAGDRAHRVESSAPSITIAPCAASA